MSDCGVTESRFKSRHGQLCFSQQPLQYTVLDTGCTPLQQCLDWVSLLPSVGQ